MLTAHRFPAGLSGIIPTNTGGLGDPLKSRAVYHYDEVQPLQEIIKESINADPDIKSSLKITFREPDFSKKNS